LRKRLRHEAFGERVLLNLGQRSTMIREDDNKSPMVLKSLFTAFIVAFGKHFVPRRQHHSIYIGFQEVSSKEVPNSQH
jgi:hypothetical protein